MRAVGQPISGYAARVALFWAFLATTPIFLLRGLMAGLIGGGLQADLMGLLGYVVFLWFWITGLKEAKWGRA
jgi:hypothetical protein